MRFFLRAAPYGLGLLFAALCFPLPFRTKPHPARILTFVCLGILALSLLSPQTVSLKSGAFHVLLYLAIFSPLFWVPKLEVDRRTFAQLVLILWSFHTLSSVVGILQVYFPEKFEFQLSSVIESKGEGYVNSLRLALASGKEIFRPMGLTDTPGGAANSGYLTIILGFVMLLLRRGFVLRVLCLLSMIVGMACIGFSQVRSVLVLAFIFLLALAFIFAKEGHHKILFRILIIGALVVGVGLAWALTVGGEEIRERLSTLVQEKPTSVYYKERGYFLEETLRELAPKYPWGAGLGRWGMVSYYFGHENPLWAEVQVTGWLYDGGIPLIIVYTLLLLLTLITAMGIAAGPYDLELKIWGALLFAYNVGAVAVTFNYPLFISEGGLNFWLLNAVLYALARGSRGSPYALR
jgi:hypothetical protein